MVNVDKFYAKIEFAVYAIYRYISAFIANYDGYFASLYFNCLQYVWPALQLSQAGYYLYQQMLATM